MNRVMAAGRMLALSSIVMVGLGGVAPGEAQSNGRTLPGVWRSGDSAVRITVTRGEVEGRFVEVGRAAASLGFKVGDVSLRGTQRAEFLLGEQTIRYGTTQPCYAEGRKVPLIGWLTPDGGTLVLHTSNVLIGADCKDTGEYGVDGTLWTRAAR